MAEDQVRNQEHKYGWPRPLPEHRRRPPPFLNVKTNDSSIENEDSSMILMKILLLKNDDFEATTIL